MSRMTCRNGFIFAAAMCLGLVVTSARGGHFGTDGFNSYDLHGTPYAEMTNYLAWEAVQIQGAGLTWNRTLLPFGGGQFSWYQIEEVHGVYNWTNADALVSACQARGIQLLALAHPYTLWDQPGKTAYNYGKPQDTNAFKAFLMAMVERYDGDGVSDMPGLASGYGIHHWEIGNEPEAVFFGGNSNRPQQYTDYRDTLRMAYETIKSADSNAVVMNAGTSPIYDPLTTNFVTGVMEFWDNVITNQGGSNYIDVLNIHYTVPEPSKPLYDFLNLWSKFNKPVWVSESGTYAGALQRNSLTYPFRSESVQAAWWVKHCCYGLSHNVQKLFWATFYNGPLTPDWMQYSAMIDSNQTHKLIYTAQQILATKVDAYTSLVEVAYSDTAGRYKFFASNLVEVLWDDSNDVVNVSGDFTSTWVRVTDALGNVSTQSAASVTLGSNVVYVEAFGMVNDRPAAPTGVQATDGTYTDKVRVSWDASSGATNYEVWRHTSDSSGAASKISSPDPTGTSYDDTSATAGTTYYYWVKAVNAEGASSFSASDSGFLGVVGPLITANGLVGDVYLNSGDPVTIAVQMMNIEPYLGAEVDWWVVALAQYQDPAEWYYLDSSPQWQEVLFSSDLSVFHPVYQGPLDNLSSTAVLSGITLPPGTYDFWFAVDYPMDGILNLNGPILYDNVTVFVQ